MGSAAHSPPAPSSEQPQLSSAASHVRRRPAGQQRLSWNRLLHMGWTHFVVTWLDTAAVTAQLGRQPYLPLAFRMSRIGSDRVLKLDNNFGSSMVKDSVSHG